MCFAISFIILVVLCFFLFFMHAHPGYLLLLVIYIFHPPLIPLFPSVFQCSTSGSFFTCNLLPAQYTFWIACNLLLRVMKALHHMLRLACLLWPGATMSVMSFLGKDSSRYSFGCKWRQGQTVTSAADHSLLTTPTLSPSTLTYIGHEYHSMHLKDSRKCFWF